MPMIYKIDELDVAHVDDAQAAAIGRLTLSFNFLEASLNYATTFMLSTNATAEIDVLMGRMTFQQKIDRLDALVKFFARSLNMPAEATPNAAQVDKWAAESLAEWLALRERVRKAAEYRNGLIHCTVDPRRDKPNPRLLSRSGAELSSDAESIAHEAKRFGALGIEIVSFGQQFRGSIRNFKKRHAEIEQS